MDRIFRLTRRETLYGNREQADPPSLALGLMLTVCPALTEETTLVYGSGDYTRIIYAI